MPCAKVGELAWHPHNGDEPYVVIDTRDDNCVRVAPLIEPHIVSLFISTKGWNFSKSFEETFQEWKCCKTMEDHVEHMKHLWRMRQQENETRRKMPELSAAIKKIVEQLAASLPSTTNE
jgi:hypothetical protein